MKIILSSFLSLLFCLSIYVLQQTNLGISDIIFYSGCLIICPLFLIEMLTTIKVKTKKMKKLINAVITAVNNFFSMENGAVALSSNI